MKLITIKDYNYGRIFLSQPIMVNLLLAVIKLKGVRFQFHVASAVSMKRFIYSGHVYYLLKN